VIKTVLISKVIENLRKMDMGDCVKVSETVNKDMLKTYPDDKIIQSGASIKKDDTFWYETDKQQLSDTKDA
jgi:hypothetical protein